MTKRKFHKYDVIKFNQAGLRLSSSKMINNKYGFQFRVISEHQEENLAFQIRIEDLFGNEVYPDDSRAFPDEFEDDEDYDCFDFGDRSTVWGECYFELAKLPPGQL